MTTVDLSQSRQTEILVVAWVMTGAAILTVGVKLFARVKIVQVVDWADFFICFSLILSIIASSFVHYGVALGFGRHTAAIAAEYGVERLFKTAKFQMLGYPFNIGAFSFPNISIAILVCQLLEPNPRRTFILYGMAILQVIFAVITMTLAFSQCRPTQKLWEKTLPGSCWNPNVLNYFSYWLCAYTTLTDVVLAVVPVRAFWQLQMPISTKVGLCVMMSLTMLSAIVTIIKGTYLPLFTDTTDPLYKPVPLVLWGLVEQNIVIIAACIPTIRPFFHRAWKRDTSTGNAYSASSDPFANLSTKGSHTGHRRVGSATDVALEDIYNKDDAASQESQQGIIRTVDVPVDWRARKAHRASDKNVLE
ncbi:uncharacterized protein K460DRAFT_358873 [Cucurbitaria berberidis CBS 394.84]|uniref:Rhodopsin domain-containing protein n=1 Tax=Cucurbitaria berberidis CBS 394.84 TaxID=1168544 RepID=A0A9P4GB12_9PLEO|nr:uncharacterized protein K460DRAFT_358873 [Cucurbitaria berberidis CBS 394.84]KAF1842234.1 hypothetical protein K460DRAFT_358873 [Cucurbitaria berberidis CBS 394.84]